MKNYINTNRIRDIRDEASRAAHDIYPDRVSVAISKDVINDISQDSINVIKRIYTNARKALARKLRIIDYM